MQDIIVAIRASHRERCFAMEQRKRADLSLLSFLRTQAGWRLDLPEKERKDIAERAKAFADGADDEGLDRYRGVVEAAVAARQPFDDVETAALKEMERLAVKLPVWESFGEPIRGFGPASLAVIVGEAGDLSIYSNPAKLWKRMGVGIVDGIRQGGLTKNASKEEWIEHGYNRQRRSRLWNIGDALIKSNREGTYRTAYLQRKDYEIARDPEMKPIKAHRRAQRYMEKMLLRDLWSAWRQTIAMANPLDRVSAASHSDQQATDVLRPNQAVPAAATGLQAHDAHVSRAGRSLSSEAKLPSQPSLDAPRKRRATVLATPDQGTPGAPSIQQAIPDEQPKKLSPADARGYLVIATQERGAPRPNSDRPATGSSSPIREMPDGSPTVLSSPPKRVTSGSKVSRANGTGDRHGRPETPNGTAITR